LIDEIGEGAAGSLKAAHLRRNWLKHISGMFNHAVDVADPSNQFGTSEWDGLTRSKSGRRLNAS
jgi:hypothetical protein